MKITLRQACCDGCHLPLHRIRRSEGALRRGLLHKLQVGAIRHDAPGILADPQGAQDHLHMHVRNALGAVTTTKEQHTYK